MSCRALLPLVLLPGMSLLAAQPGGFAPAEAVQRMVPAGTTTEGLTWATTGLIVGFSAATWISGRLVDARGVSTAFMVATASGLCALAACLLAARRLPA